MLNLILFISYIGIDALCSKPMKIAEICLRHVPVPQHLSFLENNIFHFIAIRLLNSPIQKLNLLGTNSKLISQCCLFSKYT